MLYLLLAKIELLSSTAVEFLFAVLTQSGDDSPHSNCHLFLTIITKELNRISFKHQRNNSTFSKEKLYDNN